VRVLVAMSGGVDSSVAAALALEAGHEVVGATLRLWGGPSDQGCCSVADVEDARRVAAQLGIDHVVFDLAEDFEHAVVAPWVAGHAAGRTPNPCVECNRRLKFDRLLDRALRLGFDVVATGHHARSGLDDLGRARLRRGADLAKDQSYVLALLDQRQLRRSWFPVGELTKAEVRERARALGLATWSKPDSLELCFVSAETGRAGFLRERVALTPGEWVDVDSGERLGPVPALELLTVGQRRGVPAGPGGTRRYVVGVDLGAGLAYVGPLERALVTQVDLEGLSSPVELPGPDEVLLVQGSAHGRPVAGWLRGRSVCLAEPSRPVAPGQVVVCYRGDEVVAAGVASAPRAEAGSAGRAVSQPC
jgi:tRNA-specific 2-thiouridylase